MKIWAKLWKKHWFLRKSKMAEIKNGEFGVLLKWFLRVYRRLLEIIRPLFDSCWWDPLISFVKMMMQLLDWCKMQPQGFAFLYWFLYGFAVTKKTVKILQSFALCRFQNSFSYVFGTFSPSNSIFVNKWIMHSFTKNVFLIKIRFDILSFWTQVFPKNDENNIINESNTNFFDHFFPDWGFLSQMVVITFVFQQWFDDVQTIRVRGIVRVQAPNQWRIAVQISCIDVRLEFQQSVQDIWTK